MKRTNRLKLLLPVLCLLSLAPSVHAASMDAEMHDAVNSGDQEKVATLLKADPKLANAKDADGHTPLGSIAFRMSLTVTLNSAGRGTAGSEPVKDPRVDIAALLIANGANVDPEPNRTAPLLGAVRGQNWPLAKLLIEKGARTDVAMAGGGDNGMTPLHYAAVFNNAEIATLLIARNATINARDGSGFTPLNLAAGGTEVAVLKVLIDAGGDVNAPNNSGETPLARATEYGTKETVDLLKAQGAKSGQIHIAIDGNGDVTIDGSGEKQTLTSLTAYLRANPPNRVDVAARVGIGAPATRPSFSVDDALKSIGLKVYTTARGGSSSHSVWVMPAEAKWLVGEKEKPVPASMEKTPDARFSALPPFREPASGSNEVRVRNPNTFSASVGLRSGDKGNDFQVGPKAVASVYVPDGAYEVYFVYSTEPQALYQGDSFNLQGNGVEIQIVEVVNGNYGIRRVK